MSGFHRRSPVRAFVCALALSLASPSRAQQPQGSANVKRTLAELVSLAVQNTPLLQSQDARVEERRLSAAQARVWGGPSIGALSGRTKQAEASGSRVELSLSQPIPLTGLPRLRGGLLQLESDSLGIERFATQLAVTAAVVESSYDYAVDRRKAEFAQRRQKRFELVRDYLSGRVFATPQKRAESRIVRNRLKLLSSEAIQSQAAVKTALQKLRVYAPLEGEPEVEVPRLSGERALDEGDWLGRALANNPALRVQRLVVSRAGVEKTLASREGLPDASLIASYENGQRDIIGTDYGLGLSLAFPSWNRNRSGIKSAERRRVAEERQLAFDELRLKGELTALLAEYEAARLIVRQYPPEAFAEIDEQLKDAEEGFRKGQLDLLTFLEIESSAAETFGRALDAQRDLAAKAAALISAAGEQDVLGLLGTL